LEGFLRELGFVGIHARELLHGSDRDPPLFSISVATIITRACFRSQVSLRYDLVPAGSKRDWRGSVDAWQKNRNKYVKEKEVE
ncbi:hypothetical protein L916_00617, partial [Phytophthora nicotianae]